MLNVVQDAYHRAERFRGYSRYALGAAWGLVVFSVVATAATSYSYYLYRLELRVDLVVVSVVFFSAPPIAMFWVYEMFVSAALKYSNRALRTRNAILQERASMLENSQCPDQACTHCRTVLLHRRADKMMAAWNTDLKSVDDGG